MLDSFLHCYLISPSGITVCADNKKLCLKKYQRTYFSATVTLTCLYLQYTFLTMLSKCFAGAAENFEKGSNTILEFSLQGFS